MMAMMTLMQEGARVRHTCRKEVNFKKPRYYSYIISDVGFCIFIVRFLPHLPLEGRVRGVRPVQGPDTCGGIGGGGRAAEGEGKTRTPSRF